MKAADVHCILSAKGARTLFHANTVGTSCSFLQLGGLASRALVEGRGLRQTPQDTDDSDKHFGIWNDVFTDTIDVHARGSMRNFYGPVLFQLSVDVLLFLPPDTDVLVTKRNPYNWVAGEADTTRWFADEAEFAANGRIGDMGQHAVLRNAAGFVQFPPGPVSLIVDNPGIPVHGGKDAYETARAILVAVAATAGVDIQVEPRTCSDGCCCVRGRNRCYERLPGSVFHSLFT